jgi:hypothetical protein
MPSSVREPRFNKARLIFGVILCLLTAWFMWFRNGSEPTAPVGASFDLSSVQDAGDDSELVAQSGSKSGPARPHLETSRVFAPKDPFDPLVETTIASTDETLVSGTSGTSSQSTTNGSSNNEQGSSADEADSGLKVEVVREANSAAIRIDIDGAEYRPTEGDTFAHSFKLLSFEQECAVMLYGDEQFTLCVGEEIIK